MTGGERGRGVEGVGGGWAGWAACREAGWSVAACREFDLICNAAQRRVSARPLCACFNPARKGIPQPNPKHAKAFPTWHMGITALVTWPCP